MICVDLRERLVVKSNGKQLSLFIKSNNLLIGQKYMKFNEMCSLPQSIKVQYACEIKLEVEVEVENEIDLLKTDFSSPRNGVNSRSIAVSKIPVCG